jgi:hypothetical protein
MRPDPAASEGIKYSIIYLIHGDGSYIYHDKQGKVRRADREALALAQTVAKGSPQTEVFIFHQRPERRVLLFFLLKESEFFYYRQGRLLHKEAYFKSQSTTGLDLEAQFYERYAIQKRHAAAPPLKTFFVYFGHHLPEFNGAGRENIAVSKTPTLQQFSAGLKKFQTGAFESMQKFDVLVLSSCYSGTPGVIAALLPYAKFIIASPDNLHLSYLDTQEFLELGDGETFAPADFAREVARRSFEKQQANTQTMITIAVYDTEKIAPFLQRIKTPYETTIMAASKSGAESGISCYDCLNNAAFNYTGAANGVEVFYQPPRFGRKNAQRRHSGWTCWQIKPEKAFAQHPK